VPRPSDSVEAPAEEPPVALNAEPTVQYPPALYDQGIEGDVELRLFVDSTGRLARESTRVTESSGYAALDSAATRGVSQLRYAPARRHGLPVATAFLQTIEFRHPGAAGAPTMTTRITRADTARPSRDTTPTPPRPRPDSARVRDTTSPPHPPPAPSDTTKSKPDSSGAAP
jgi:TonB family protein